MSLRPRRIPIPPQSGNASVDQWTREVASAFNALPFSTFSTASGPNDSRVTAPQGFIGIEIGTSPTKFWLKTQGSSGTGWTPIMSLREEGLVSGFNEVKTASRTNIIELKSTYGLSALRDVRTTAGSGAVSHQAASGEFRLVTTASGSDSATLDSAERGRYLPGFEATVGIGVRTDFTPSGSQVAKWGLFDDDNGFYFGSDATGVFIAYLRGGSETKVYQSSWNVDPLDGTGASGLTLDTSAGNIYQINFAWYGYGTIEWQVVLNKGTAGGQEVFVVHRFTPTAQTSVVNPNLPIRASVANGGTAATSALYIGGRKYAIVGEFRPNRRRTSARRLEQGSIGTTFVPLVSFRRKSDFRSVSVKLSSVDILTDANIVWQLRLNATLTGASYATPTDHTASETALEADISATAISGGEVLDQGFISSAAGNKSIAETVEALDFDLIGLQPITLCARRITGTNATVSSVLVAREEW